MTGDILGTTISTENRFLVCGLGSLGQHCVLSLKEFGVNVIAIEREIPKNWEISHLPQLLDQLIIGDCRQIDILEQAKISQCSAILIVTSDEEVNAQTAITARHINPTIRLVVRSSQENFNHLLGEQLGNFFAGCPNRLANTAFGLAVMQDNIIGFFSLDGQQLKVIKRKITFDDPWCYKYLVSELNTLKRRVLSCKTGSASNTFHQWEPDAKILPGDTITYVELVENNPPPNPVKISPLRRAQNFLTSFLKNMKMKFQDFRNLDILKQVSNVVAVSGTVFLLLIFGTILFRYNASETTFTDSFYTTAILLLGGFGDVFQDPLKPKKEIPNWLELFSLCLTVFGTIFVGILYASLTEVLLSTKFDLANTRPAVPEQEHLIVVGLGRIGEGVAIFLQKFKQSLVVVSLKGDVAADILPNIAIVTGDFNEAVNRVNIQSARSLILTTDNEMLNLEIALIARSLNPDSHLVIRASKEGLSSKLKGLLDNIELINTYEVSSAAFAGAAFGENIVSLFRQEETIILVTEYQIRAHDTINGLLISEFSYGYSVVVILYEPPDQKPRLMPSDDLRLEEGDHIVILASMDGLKRIERGEIERDSQSWTVRIAQIFSDDSILEGAKIISRISGCSLNLATDMMNDLPKNLPVSLYKHQAYNLMRELQKIIIKAELISLEDE